MTQDGDTSAATLQHHAPGWAAGVPNKETRGQRAWFLALAVIAALLLFPALRRPGLAGYDDSFFSHEAKEMVRTGDWGNVRLNGEIILQIPPMFLWLQACSFKIFGINDAAGKLPAVALGFGTILLMYFLTLQLTGDAWLAVLAMLVLTSTQFFLKNATHAMTDVPFTFFFTLVIFCYLKGLKKNVYLSLLGVPLGCALLTRSVVAFLALGIVLAHLALTKRYKLLRSPWLIGGVVLALAFPCAWYGWQYQQHGAAFLLTHLQFLGGKIHGEGASGWKTIFNYPMALLKYYWPWLPLLIVGLLREWRAAVREKESAAILLIVWVLLVFVPFSLVETRYPRYIMAAFPAFSIITAMTLHRWIPMARRKLFFHAACAVGVVAVCLSLLLPPKARAEDMVKLAPIAEANCGPDQRVLMYTYENGREDYLFQFIWYSSRYAQLASSVDDLADALNRAQSATVIVDKASYKKLLPMLAGKTPQILGESENLICFRVE
jgi:4-amino-4-deoxy-L-arabinose transferase-like glycosyltransferase